MKNDHAKKLKMEPAIRVFSLISGLFMGVGTAYLLTEAIAAIGFLAMLATGPFALPFMASMGFLMLCSGIAYAKISYNSITDMIYNDIPQKWLNLIKQAYSDGFKLKNCLRSAGIIILLSMAAFLTVCSAGTWWTIIKTTEPVFSSLKRLPFFIMAIINPIVIAISNTAFNLSNSYETYSELVEMAEAEKESKGIFQSISEHFAKLDKKENAVQKWNIFRIALQLLLTPARMLLFIGHLASIGVTTDQVPKIPSYVTAIFGLIAEGFEDFHYFVPGAAHEGHDHNNDILSQLLKISLSPLFMLAIIWDWAASKLNDDQTKNKLSFVDACKKHELFIFDYYHPESKENETEAQEIPKDLAQTSDDWKKEHCAYRIDHYCEKHLNQAWAQKEKASRKKEALQAFKVKVLENKSNDDFHTIISKESKNEVYNQHRWFESSKETETQKFLQEDLASRVDIHPAARLPIPRKIESNPTKLFPPLKIKLDDNQQFRIYQGKTCKLRLGWLMRNNLAE